MALCILYFLSTPPPPPPPPIICRVLKSEGHCHHHRSLHTWHSPASSPPPHSPPLVLPILLLCARPFLYLSCLSYKQHIASLHPPSLILHAMPDPHTYMCVYLHVIPSPPHPHTYTPHPHHTLTIPSHIYTTPSPHPHHTLTTPSHIYTTHIQLDHYNLFCHQITMNQAVVKMCLFNHFGLCSRAETSTQVKRSFVVN